MLRDLLKPNDFMAKIDLKKNSLFSLEGYLVGVCLPPIWNSKCPRVFFKIPKPCDRPVKEAGNSSNHLFGRFFTNGLHGKISIIPCHLDGHPSAISMGS